MNVLLPLKVIKYIINFCKLSFNLLQQIPVTGGNNSFFLEIRYCVFWVVGECCCLLVKRAGTNVLPSEGLKVWPLKELR